MDQLISFKERFCQVESVLGFLSLGSGVIYKDNKTHLTKLEGSLCHLHTDLFLGVFIGQLLKSLTWENYT